MLFVSWKVQHFSTGLRFAFVNERTNGNFNASVTTDTASSANSCEYKQWLTQELWGGGGGSTNSVENGDLGAVAP